MKTAILIIGLIFSMPKLFYSHKSDSIGGGVVCFEDKKNITFKQGCKPALGWVCCAKTKDFEL